MPYAPGNENMSGQILGRSISKALDDIASGYTEMDKQREQDKIFSSRAKATESLIKAHLPKEKWEPLLRTDPDESPAARYGRLTDEVQNFVLDSDLKSKQQEQAARQQAMDQAMKDNAALQGAMNQFIAPGTGQQIQAGAGFRDLQTPGTMRQNFDPRQFGAAAIAGGLSPSGVDKIDSFTRAMMPMGTGKPIMNPASFDVTDPKTGKRMSRTVDQMTGQEIGYAEHPFQQTPEVPNPLVLKQYEDLSKDRAEKALPAMNTLAALDNIQDIVDSGDFISGKGAPYELAARKIGTYFGGNDSKVSNTEFIGAQLTSQTLALLKQLGSGTGLSDTDLKFAKAAAGNDITLEPATIQRLARVNRRLAEKAIGDYNDRLESTFPAATDNAQYKQARSSLGVPTRKALTVEEVLSKY